MHPPLSSLLFLMALCSVKLNTTLSLLSTHCDATSLCTVSALRRVLRLAWVLVKLVHESLTLPRRSPHCLAPPLPPHFDRSLVLVLHLPNVGLISTFRVKTDFPRHNEFNVDING
ncbi:hypothetical protein GALMADRAFT_225787 [Galerina marginata CBS 339.88]|uniref:Secreted protein n=1 Tax=Galerina marginata (strain CBS 339.88) TaxID=685588 RepID=A0A067T1A2_GALM3|nr:hypothetical protein GALMADRAFT_225787 [Galerina marginata CBS 339.88]